jgi:hypothetical protein
VLEETASKIEKEKSQKDAEKRQLEQENLKLKDQIESILFLKKQDEFLIDVLKRKEHMLQESFRDMMSFMNICDTTITHDLNKSTRASPQRRSTRRSNRCSSETPPRSRRRDSRSKRVCSP